MTKIPKDSNGKDATKEGATIDRVEPEVLDHDSPIPDEILAEMPRNMREKVSETFGIMASGPMQSPISKKVTSEHISQMIGNDAKDSERGYTFAQTGRLYTMGYVLIAIATFFGMAWMVSADIELFVQILAFFATFGAGFGAGWGFTAAKGKSKD